MRKLILAAAAALFATQSAAQAPAPPKLLVVIAVDQFSADLFDEYRPQFTGGLARLAGGTVYRNGYQSHAATETCPGHSTLLTGDHPARTGIISNIWIDQKVGRSDVSVYFAEDESVPGTSSIAYKLSPNHLLVPTLGELRKSKSPGARTVAVAGQARPAGRLGGARPVHPREAQSAQGGGGGAGAAIDQAVSSRAGVRGADGRQDPAVRTDGSGVSDVRHRVTQLGDHG